MKMKWYMLPAILLLLAFQNASAQESAANIKQERNVEKGSSVTVRNDVGDITITGWDSDRIEASAISKFTEKAVPVSINENTSSGKKSLFISPVKSNFNETGEISLQVKVPRSITLEPIKTYVATLTISNIDGLVVAQTDEGQIKISRVGAVSVQAGSGIITAEDIKGNFAAKADINGINNTETRLDLKNIGGNVEITTGDGIITARNIGGDVRLVSVDSPKIDFRCVKGRVEINDTHSIISLANLEGDVEVTNSTGETHFTGEVRAGKRYRLKTLTGVVSMAIPESSGFTALVRTYEGEARSAFTLENSTNKIPSSQNRREISGTYGDGQARIELDSFNGAARLRKAPSTAIEKCSW